MINPALWATGILYLTINLTGLDLASVAWAHVVAAYAIALFVVIHAQQHSDGGRSGRPLR